MAFGVKFASADSGELLLRVKYGVLLFAAAILLVLCGGGIFVAGIMLLACLCSAEVLFILGKAGLDPKKENKTLLKGAPLVWLPMVSLYIIREVFENGLITSFWFFILIATVDTGAYFTGKFFGRHKLAPSISAGKTIEGLAGGVLIACLISSGLYYFFNSKLPFLLFLGLSFGIAVLAQISDLAESKFKRTFDVKDSSKLIPGHGGFLDRIDGYLMTAPVLVCFYFVSKFFLGVAIFG